MTGCSTLVVPGCDPGRGAMPNRAVVPSPSSISSRSKAWIDEVTAPVSTLALMGTGDQSVITTHSRHPINGLTAFGLGLGRLRAGRWAGFAVDADGRLAEVLAPVVAAGLLFAGFLSAAPREDREPLDDPVLGTGSVY